MNTQLKKKHVAVLLFLSFVFIACEKDNLENETAVELGNVIRAQGFFVSPNGFELNINSGGDEIVYDTKTFVADTYFNGSGKTHGNQSITDIANTDFDDIYKSERSSPTTFAYEIPLEEGIYDVKLHFAEIYWGATGGGQGEEGKRIFSVDMEGRTIIADYDINEAVGSMTAVIKTNRINLTDGILNLDFSASVDQPKIAAIEIIGYDFKQVPDPIDRNKVIARINSGGGQVRFGDIVYDADKYFFEGGAYTNNTIVDIANTELDEIYKSEHNSSSGKFGYAIPVEPGHEYTVKLHFAEIYHGADGGGPDGVGKRVFSVYAEGGLASLKNIDLNEQVGTMTAYIADLTVQVKDDRLNLAFLGNVDQPKISAIEVLSSTGDIIKDACDWRTDLADANHHHIEGQTARVNGKLYLFGGFEPADNRIGDTSAPLVFENNTEIYDPIADSWSDGAPMPTELSHGGMQTVGDDIWIIGGFLGDNGGAGTDLVQIYNTTTDTWRKGPSIPIKSASVAAVFVDGRIHIYGGYDESREINLDQHFYYDLNNTQAGWQALAPLPVARGHHGGEVIDGIIYAMGGQIGHNTTNLGNIPNVEAYDFTTNTWTNVAPLPVKRSHFELSTLHHKGKIMIAGGNEGASNILQYDPSKDVWEEYCNGLPNAMLTPTMMISGDKLIITCGGLGNNWNPTKETIWITAPN